jgi:signal recognition particle receptor subunit beta
MDANIESLEDLKINLNEQGYELYNLPFTMQYNKRDIDDIAPVETLSEALNPTQVPEFTAIAPNGDGVFETLKDVCRQVILELKKHY